MRMPHPTPTSRPLPFEQARGGLTDDLGAPAMFTELALSGPAVAQFDALVHELYPDAARVDQTRLQRLAAWLLSLSPESARTELDERLQSIEELRAMLDDPAWDSDAATRARTDKLLAYVDRDDDLIPDRVPLLGLLDDVLLIELAWPAFADEVAEYRDFCSYRQTEHPTGTPVEQREAWLRDRLAEIARLQDREHLGDSHFIENRPESHLRVT
jgi:uncharacterized membrane protein YkvA (DUF1232 family)